MKPLHRIRVMGRELHVRSAAPVDRVLEIESFVNEKVAEAEATTRGGDTQYVAILAMLNIAETYLALVGSQGRTEPVDSEQIWRMVEKINDVLSGR